MNRWAHIGAVPLALISYLKYLGEHCGTQFAIEWQLQIHLT